MALIPCIFCGSHFESLTNKPEHIVPCALGGRITSKLIVCAECNGRLGNEVDARLAQLFEEVRFLLVVKDCKGNLPPAITFDTDEGPVVWQAGQHARMHQLARPSVAPKPDGTTDIQGEAKDLEHAAWLTAHMMNRVGATSIEQLNINGGGIDVRPFDQSTKVSVPFADQVVS